MWGKEDPLIKNIYISENQCFDKLTLKLVTPF